MPLQLSVERLLAWNDVTAIKWRDFILANPAVLAQPSDIRESSTVTDTVQHIVAVELRYAQRLIGIPETPYDQIPKDSIESLFSVHLQAVQLIKAALEDTSYDWSVRVLFQTRSAGALSTSRETILVHLLMHSIRHYAQLATLVRQRGYQPAWQMDYLFMDVEPA
jgi:uncharacterized damage-inducible protein DinB